MLIKIQALLLALLGAILTLGAEATSLPDTIEKIKPAIVGVGRYNELANPRARVTGTGFAVSDGSMVVTNYHVIEPIISDTKDVPVIFIGTGKDPELRKVEMIAKDELYDLALLKVPGSPLPAMTLLNSEAREGSSVAFTGYPIGSILGLYPVTHRGIISAITPIVIPASTARSLNAKLLRRLREPFNVYQLDATAYPGNSGSPMFDPDTGVVLGIINKVFIKESKEAVLEKPSGITYAIPVVYLEEMLAELTR